MSFTVELPYPHKVLWPNGRTRHLGYKATLTRDHKNWAFWAVREKCKPGSLPDNIEHVKIGIKLVLKARTTAPDEDNTSAAMKAYLDGMAQAMGVDDKIFKPQPVEFGERTRNGAVIFTIEPVVAQKPETT